MEAVFDQMMIDTPNNVKGDKRQKYDELQQSFAFKNIDGHQKKYSCRNEKKIVKGVVFNLFFKVIC